MCVEVRFLGIYEPMKGFCTLSRLNHNLVVYRYGVSILKLAPEWVINQLISEER